MRYSQYISVCVCVLKLTFLHLNWRWTDDMCGFGFVLSGGALMNKKTCTVSTRTEARPSTPAHRVDSDLMSLNDFFQLSSLFLVHVGCDVHVWSSQTVILQEATLQMRHTHTHTQVFAQSYHNL